MEFPVACFNAADELDIVRTGPVLSADMEEVTLSNGSERTTKLMSNVVVDSDFISGDETVNDVSKIPNGLARRDRSLSTTARTQFQTQGIDVHLMVNSHGDRL
jgi:hypothetical protein